MATEWFYARGDQKQGPLSSAELGQLARSGKLLRTDLIWKEGMSEWRPAGEAAKLFEGVTSPEPSPSNVAPPPSESATVAFGDRAKVAAKSLGEKAKSAAQAAAAQAVPGLKQSAQKVAQAAQLAAERTKLSTVTIPGAYLQLGQHCYTSQAFASEFPADFTTLARVAASLAAADVAPVASQPSPFSERAQALAGKGLGVAKKQKAAFDQANAFRRLGQAAFEKHGSRAGPTEIVTSIKTALDRIAAIDQQLAGYKASLWSKGSPTKKTLLIGSLGAALALLVAFLGYGMWSKRSPTTPGTVALARLSDGAGGQPNSSNEEPVSVRSEGATKPRRAKAESSDSPPNRRQRASLPEGSLAGPSPDIAAVLSGVAQSVAEVGQRTEEERRQRTATNQPSLRDDKIPPVASRQSAAITSNAPVGPTAAKDIPTSAQAWNPPTFTITEEWRANIPAPESTGFSCGDVIEFSPDQQKVAVGLANGCLVLCDPTKGPYAVTESAVGWKSTPTEFVINYHVSAISFSPSGKNVAWLTDSVTYTWAVADVASGKTIWRSPSASSRTPWTTAEDQPRWGSLGKRSLRMIDDDTLIFSWGCGIVRFSSSRQRDLLNGGLPLTMSSQQSLSIEDYQKYEKPIGEWFDDDLRATLAKPPRQGIPHPYDKYNRVDTYTRYATSLSPNGKYCAVVFRGPHSPELEAGANRSLGPMAVAVYEVGGRLVYRQDWVGHPPGESVPLVEDVIANNDASVLSIGLSHVRRYRNNAPVELLCVVGGPPTYIGLQADQPFAFAVTQDSKAQVFGLGHPEVMRGEGLLCSVSFRDQGKTGDGYGVVSKDFTQCITGRGNTIGSFRIQSIPPSSEK